MKASDNQPALPGPDGDFPLAKLEELYERGLYLQLYGEAVRFGSLEQWPGLRGQVLAGKIAHHLGCLKRGRWLHWKAFKRNRRNPYAAYYYGWHLMEFRGPYRLWEFLETFPDDPAYDPRDRADLFGLRCRCATYLRDFETAERWLLQAEEVCPELPWLYVERAHLAELQDKYELSLDIIEKAFSRVPYYRPAAQAKAHLLVLLGREVEALNFLEAAAQALECSSIYAQLFTLQMEAQMYPAALQCMEQFLKHAPLIDKETRQWLELQRCDALYFSGHVAAARELAEKASEHEFYLAFAQRLKALEEGSESPRRTVLPIGFVRQHHMTCGPATLTAISNYWNKPANHLEVAERICYDGTPAQNERSWAEQNGYVARDFRVTTETAAALLDRGIPFTLTTTEATSAHLQAVIGYDLPRQSLLIRDPYVRTTVEFLAEKALERYAAYGPRGMALVPREKAELLEGLELPEARLYDLYYELNCALDRHDRDRAWQTLRSMLALEPKHRLTITARRTLAGYDGNATETLTCLKELLDLFPEESHLQLCRVNAWRELGHPEERIKWLKELCGRKTTDSVLLQELAIELSGDARESDEALRLLKRAARWRRADAANLLLRGNLHWSRREFERALTLYRFALCLEEKREHYAYSYFQAARYLERTTEALTFLTRRFQVLGKKSAQPGMTLFWAYEQLDQLSSAFSIMEMALQFRPEDGDLLLFSAECYGRYGNTEQARRLLAAAKSKSREYSWYSSAALLREIEGKYAEALQLWEKILQREPLNLAAVRSAARLKDMVHGRSAVLEFLKKCCESFPHHFPLHQLWNEYARHESTDLHKQVLDKIILINGQDSWAWRELALFHVQNGQPDEGLACAQKAVAIDPNTAVVHGVLGWVLRQRGETFEAKEAFRRALQISVDHTDAMEELVSSCETLEQKASALAFIENELGRQAIYGDGVLTFRRVASGILADCDLEKALRRLHAKRSDLWHTASALSAFLADVGRVDEALHVAREAVGRFGLIPRVWGDLARVHKARSEAVEEVAALKEALKINSRWPILYTQLALALERAGEPAEAIATLEKGITHEPRDSSLHGLLGDFHWRHGDKTRAIESLKKAVELDVGYRWAWDMLEQCAVQTNQAELPATLARELTARKPGEPLAWLALAHLLRDRDKLEERLSCIDRAITLAPRDVAAHDARCEAFAMAGKWEEALEAANPPWNGPLPAALRSRAAWVEAARGNMKGAVEKMRALLKDDPAFGAGWSDLCGWLLQLEDLKGAEEAAQGLIRAQPLDSVSYGYSGKIKLLMGDKAGGLELLHRALELDPAYGFAANTITEIEIEDGNFEAAEKLLKTVEATCGTSIRLGKELAIAVRKGERKKALELFREIGLRNETPEEEIVSVHKLIAPNQTERDVEKLIESFMEAAAAHPVLGALWVSHKLKRQKFGLVRKLMRLRQTETGVGERAILAYIQTLGMMSMAPSQVLTLDRWQLAWHLRRIIKKAEPFLRENDFCWGMTGFALNATGQHRMALAWLGDFSNRKGAGQWMIHNFADSAHTLGKEALAREAINHGLGLQVIDDGNNSLVCWAALYAILDGQSDLAPEILARGNHEKLNAYDQALFDAVKLLLTYVTEQNPPAFSSDQKKILATFITRNRGNKCMQNAFRRMTALISERTGKRWIKVWGWITSYVQLV